MEYSLHRQIKEIFAAQGARTEVRVGSYRIDAVLDGELIEIQHASLSALKTKIPALLEENSVRVLRPIIAKKLIVNLSGKEGKEVSRRTSRRRENLLSIFDELIYFTRVFPHERLKIELLLVEIEEWRYPGTRRRRSRKPYQVSDKKLVRTLDHKVIHVASDLIGLLNVPLEAGFHTGELAARLGVPRYAAQRIAYCLCQCGATRTIGKRGNTRLYAAMDESSSRAA